MNIVVLNPTVTPARNTRKAGFWARVWTAFRVYGERQELAGLSDHMLDDIGVTRDQADYEVRRSVFDLPTHR